jgi:hypothetical protein
MKKILILVFSMAYASSALAQCNDYYHMQQGTAWAYETLDAKGKTQGKNQQVVKAYAQTPTGFKATINSVMTNEKGKKLMEGDLEMTCDNGTIIMDMRRFIPEEQMKAMGNFEMKIESENLEVPSKLTVGQALKNGSITMNASNSPVPMKMMVEITDRKVEAKETITTPAGIFECYKISSKSTIENQMGMTMKFEFTNIEWITEKVGMVKSELFDKNGKSNGTTILVSRK